MNMQKSKLQSPVRFLPSLPETRRKPVWQDTPAFKLIKNGEIEEITPLGASPAKKSKNGKGIGRAENGNAQNGSAGQNKSLVKTVNYPKKDRESFREALVNIIMHNDTTAGPPKVPSVTEGELAPVRTGSPTSAEKDILRYYYYIHHGIDTKNVAPMEDNWIDNIMSLVPE